MSDVNILGVEFAEAVKNGARQFSLKNIYQELYEHVPWPEPIPRPTDVQFEWSYGRKILGQCSTYEKVIRINCLYKIRSLHAELFHLMAHETAHFIWLSHDKAFRQYL